MKTISLFVLLLTFPLLLLLSCDSDVDPLSSSEGPSATNLPYNPSPASGAQDIDTASVTLSWDYDGPEGECTYSLLWGISCISQSRDTLPGLTITNYTLNHLSPGCRYFWKVNTINVSGDTTRGSYWYFCTVDKIVQFDDYMLELRVRQLLERPTGDIYASDVGCLSYLGLSSAGIEDLRGIEYLIGLNSLNLCENELTDISPLSNLTWMESLYIGSTQISNISPLSNMINMEYLSAGDNAISDITPLACMTNMEYLYLGSNQIRQLSAIAEMTNLRSLTLDNNQINDISGISGATSLTWLTLSYNNISDLSPLLEALPLSSIYLSNNQISDISPLSNMILLRSIHSEKNQITDITPLSNLLLLEYVDLDSNNINDISAFSDLPFIHGIHLSGNEISNVEPLVNNPYLGWDDYVYLYDNPLDSMSINVYIPQLINRGIWVYF